MTDLNARIREYVDAPGNFPQSSSAAAIRAVLDKCQQVRQATAAVDNTISDFFADEFERAIADALGVEF